MTDYTINSNRLSDLEKRVKRLNKRGGNIELTVAGTRVEKYTDQNGHKQYREVTDVALEGLAPVVSGWSFLAALERLETGGNVVTTVPGTECPAQYREAEPNCDHCGTNRRRIYTFILRNEETGEYKQVGKTCLQDFLRDTDPGVATGIFGLLADLEAWGDPRGGGALQGTDSVLLLAVTNAVIKQFGWVPRSRAHEGVMPTADTVLTNLHDNPNYQPDPADIEKAKAVLAWVQGMTPQSDYEHNLSTVLADGEDGFVRDKHAGIACSAVSGYDRYVERKAQQEAAQASEHYGVVGKRYRGLDVTVTRVSYCQGMYGTSTILGMVTPEGNQLVWFASNGVKGYDADTLRGARIRIDGTVKDHGEYKGIKQTKMTRCVVKKVFDDGAKG